MRIFRTRTIAWHRHSCTPERKKVPSGSSEFISSSGPNTSPSSKSNGQKFASSFILPKEQQAATEKRIHEAFGRDRTRYRSHSPRIPARHGERDLRKHSRTIIVCACRGIAEEKESCGYHLWRRSPRSGDVRS